MSNASLVKAVIIDKDHPGNDLKCLFNPKEYTFAKQNSWSKKEKKAGANTPGLDFGGGQPATLQMELFFDTYAEAKDGSEPRDVRKAYTDRLWKLMMVDPNLKEKKKYPNGRPPFVLFQWGGMWSFEAVITSLSQKFTLFLPNGTPVRATVTVSFTEVQDKAELAAQNPTSGGVGEERVWTVLEGDTLAWIAHKEYGDTSRWRLIADANHLVHVRQLVPGTVLVIPNG